MLAVPTLPYIEEDSDSKSASFAFVSLSIRFSLEEARTRVVPRQVCWFCYRCETDTERFHLVLLDYSKILDSHWISFVLVLFQRKKNKMSNMILLFR